MYNKQYKQQCRTCGKYGHKPGDKGCPEKKNEKEERIRKQKNMKLKTENLKDYATIVEGKGIGVRTVGSGSTAITKNLRK